MFIFIAAWSHFEYVRHRVKRIFGCPIEHTETTGEFQVLGILAWLTPSWFFTDHRLHLSFVHEENEGRLPQIVVFWLPSCHFLHLFQNRCLILEVVSLSEMSWILAVLGLILSCLNLFNSMASEWECSDKAIQTNWWVACTHFLKTCNVAGIWFEVFLLVDNFLFKSFLSLVQNCHEWGSLRISHLLRRVLIQNHTLHIFKW